MNTTQSKPNEPKETKTGQSESEALAAEVAALKAELARLSEQVGLEEPGALARARDVAGDLQGEFRRIESDIVTATRESPWRSLGTAGLVGMVFGLLLRR